MVSSAAVYVDATGNGFETEEFADLPVPVTEDQPTVAPGQDTYATGKVALEQAWLTSTVPTTVLRPGAIHGPGCRQPREWMFVKRVLDGRDVRVLAYDGASRFATTSTAALAELIRLAGSSPGVRVLNAADPDAPTVAAIGDAVDAAMGVSLRTVTVPGPPAEVGRTPWSVPRPVVLSMDRAATSLGYVAPGTYAETVPAAVEWLVAQVSGGADWREAFPGFVRMERAMGDFFAYDAEDRYLAGRGDPHDS